MGLVLWTLLTDENVGMAKFVSIGNKLNVDEIDMLEYLGSDPDTKVIGMYLENISDGKRLIEAAEKINKPIIALKANTTEAGSRAAMSHTASMSNNDGITDTAFKKAGIIRIDHGHEFVTMAKVFNLPPMMGNRIMVMSPGGGSVVMMADLCEKYGFEFADPGEDFFRKLDDYTNAGGIIKFSNPLDMGDIYDATVYPKIFHDVLNNKNVDGAIFANARPMIPKKDNSVFKKLFYTDISNETIGAMLSSGKPLGVTFTVPATIGVKIKKDIDYPIFNRTEEMIKAFRIQADYYSRQKNTTKEEVNNSLNHDKISTWIEKRNGNIGEEMLDLIDIAGIKTADSYIAINEKEALTWAHKAGYPVAMKIASPDILHKSDAGGVILNIENDEDLIEAFYKINNNIANYNADAVIEGIRIMKMAQEGHDMFIGAMRDDSFGPVVVFGYGGIYTEVFKDIDQIMCPSSKSEIKEKLENLKCYKILKGIRGNSEADIEAYIDIIEKISHLMNKHPQIIELDLNPVRVFTKGEGVIALDARAKIEWEKTNESNDAEMEKMEAVC